MSQSGGRRGGEKRGQKPLYKGDPAKRRILRPQEKRGIPLPASGARPAEKPTHWENVAGWYDKLVGDEGSEYHREVVIPGVRRMLKIQPGERVLDVACGQGVLCRALAEEGALVTGVDGAAGLITAAMERESRDRHGIMYAVGDARELDKIAEVGAGMFDAVTIVLAIQNITPLSPVWAGVKRALKTGGRVVVVMMHPCYRVPKRSGWHWDDATHTQSRLVSEYLSSAKVEIQMHPGARPDETTATFHRPLQAYINTMGGAGLLIDHIEEWVSHKKSQAGPKAEALDKSRKEIPMFLALRGVKIGNNGG